LPEQKSSQTALGIAVLRAAHQLIDGQPKILKDPVILRLLDEPTRLRLRDHPEAYQTERLRALRVQALVRSRFAEDQLAEAVQHGIEQFVILGAGLDTFAYRQPAWASRLQIFELDQPASQATKRRLLETAGIGAPPNLEYLEIDFEKDSLHAVLERSHFNFSEPAFFSCLGVLMYLTAPAVHSILRFVASTPAPGGIVFSFANRTAQPALPYQATVTESHAAQAGEPWLTTTQPGTLDTELRSLRFSEILLLTPAMVLAQYLRNRQDALPVPRQASIVSAKI
jgi:methyltransferase (TIGR00027 family)